MFHPGEFMWADSAYSLTPHVIPIHKQPAASDPLNKQWDTAVSHIRIRSEHCMGALKGRWSSLRGIRLSISRKRDHEAVCDWIRMCIILHNLVVDIEGEEWAQYYYHQAPPERHNVGDNLAADIDDGDVRQAGEAKRQGMVQDYAVYKGEIRQLRASRR